MGIASPDALRVLIYHDIPPEQQHDFEKQLRWLAKSWNFISAFEFSAMLSGEKPIRGRNLLLTFDDGFASNRIVAQEILNPMGIPALFFVISDFVELTDLKQSRNFIAKNILLEDDISRIPGHIKNMTWDDLAALLQQGHTIGAHTKSHVRLTDLHTIGDMRREIIESADRIAKKLGVPIDHFAYTFGDIASVNAQALAIASERFNFIYSGIRGNNSITVSPYAIRRDAINPRNSVQQVGSFVEGMFDIFYAGARHKIDNWMAGDQKGV
jgi:peptidoglycan/xylan/chitin deacetylase (PgdA/CDA1 family)